MKTMLILFSVFFLILTTVSCSNTVSPPSGADSGIVYNLINTSFESGLTGWGITGGDPAGFVILTNDSTNGSQSAYICCTNTSIAKGLYQFVVYQTNKTYSLSAYLKDIPANYKYISIELCDQSSNSLSTPYTNFSRIWGWSGWTNVTVSLGPTNMPGFIKVSFRVEIFIGLAELFVDGVVLTNY